MKSMLSAFLFLACSGPGAMVVMFENQTMSEYCAMMAAAMVASLLYEVIRYRGSRVPMAIGLFLLIFHPAWVMSVSKGDCGYMKLHMSYACTGMIFICVLVSFVMSQIYRRLRRKRIF